MLIRLYSHIATKDDIQVQRQHRGRLSLQGYRILGRGICLQVKVCMRTRAYPLQRQGPQSKWSVREHPLILRTLTLQGIETGNRSEQY